MSEVDVIVGLQRGDEGKGRFVDLAAEEYDVIARGTGGSNAGHTVYIEGMDPLALHQVPSGIAHEGKLNVMGNGVYLDPVKLESELSDIRSRDILVTPDNLAISNIAHLVMPHHILLDEAREDGDGAQGSTKSGIAFVGSDKFRREGLRAEAIVNGSISDLTDEAVDRLRKAAPQLPFEIEEAELVARASAWATRANALKPFLTDTVQLVNERLRAGDRILGEGAQAFWLDMELGMHPAVTSSGTKAGDVLAGIGVAPKHIGKVTGVMKAKKSHVGGGPFVTEIHDEEELTRLRGKKGDVSSEFGASTGRPRRLGYLDLVEIANAIEGNGVDEIALAKLDEAPHYGVTMPIATQYVYQGERVTRAPSSADEIAKCKPVYETVDLWEEDISHMRELGELPTQATALVEFIEDKLQTPITRIGVGPERTQAIARQAA